MLQYQLLVKFLKLNCIFPEYVKHHETVIIGFLNYFVNIIRYDHVLRSYLFWFLLGATYGSIIGLATPSLVRLLDGLILLVLLVLTIYSVKIVKIALNFLNS